MSTSCCLSNCTTSHPNRRVQTNTQATCTPKKCFSLEPVVPFPATRGSINFFISACVSLQVRSLAAQFGPALQAHLNLAFQDLQLCCQRGQSRSVGVAESSGGSERQPELFQVLLQSLEEAEPCRYLLQEALVHRWPTLAVMAACQRVSRRQSHSHRCRIKHMNSFTTSGLMSDH